MTKRSKKDKKKSKKTNHEDNIAKILKTPRITSKFNLDNELKQGYHMEAINRIMKGANAQVNKKLQQTAESASSKVPVETQGALSIMSRSKIYKLYAGIIFDKPFETQEAFIRAFNIKLNKEGVIDIGDTKFMSQKYLKDHGPTIDIRQATMLPPDTPPKKLKAIEAQPQDLSDYKNEKPPKKREIADIRDDMSNGTSAFVKITPKGEVQYKTAIDAGIAAGMPKGSKGIKVVKLYDKVGHIKGKDGSIWVRRWAKESELTDILNKYDEFKEFHTGKTFDMDKDIEPDDAIEDELKAEVKSWNDEEERKPLTLTPVKDYQEIAAEFAKKYVEKNDLTYI